uniref:HECT domain-containing protein n=1 Tax=Cyprinus carpio TaxID=7962 RepID=A0A8C2H3U6_CYPCA
MTRSFPSMFRKERTSGKRRFPTPVTKAVVAPTKHTSLQFYLLPAPTDRTPQGSQELKLLMAGLGKRHISLPDNSNHVEITASLAVEYPKLENLMGGWLLYKASGGSGQRKLTVIPPESEGYSAKLLKSSSNNGRHMLFIVPLQDEIDISPLPFDAPEFSKMPKSQCKTCGETLPLQALALHVESCSKPDSDQEAEEESSDCLEASTQIVSSPETSIKSDPTNKEDQSTTSKRCSICQVMFPPDYIEIHASACGESQCPVWDLSDIETVDVDTEEEAGPSGIASQTTPNQNLPSTSSVSLSDFTDEAKDWKTVQGPIKAAELYRQSVIQDHASEKPLYMHLDLTSSISDQEASLIAFYKACNAKWACPLKTRLEGDPAIGEGVNRFLFSMTTQKLKCGFHLNFGNAHITRIFDGEPDHLVPSSSAHLVDSDLFLMAGRMIGHCFLHGGPPLSGLSPAVVHVISGGSAETAVVQISDCPDFDLRQKIMLLEGESELTPDEKESINDLCFSWDLPPVNNANRRWLYERLLHHAVIGRTMRQIKQLRKGLKETMLWPLLRQRPDVLPVIFPPEKNDVLTPVCVINSISWPSMVENDDEDDNDDECSLEDKSRIAGYLRQFIESASSHELKALVKFWVGWEVPTTSLKLEVTNCNLPRASTCFETLRLPSRYCNYPAFQKELLACIGTVDTGFGLV